MLEYHLYCHHVYAAHGSQIRELICSLSGNEQLMESLIEGIFKMNCMTHLVAIRMKFDTVINCLEDIALAFAKHNNTDVVMPTRYFILDIMKTKVVKCSVTNCDDAIFYAVHRGQWVIDCLAALRSQVDALSICKALNTESTKLLKTLCISLAKNVKRVIDNHIKSSHF